MDHEKSWTKDFILNCVANLFVFVSFYFLLPILPLFTTDVFSGDAEKVGYMFAIFAFAAVITRPVAGILLDLLQRKTIARISLATLAVVMFSYDWVSSLAVLFVVRFIHGIFWGFSTTSLATLATDSIPLKKRGEGIGYYGLSISIATFFGPVLGLFALSCLGYSRFFYMGASFVVIAFLCVMALVPQKIGPLSKEVKRSFIERKVLSDAAIVFWLSFIYSGILSFIVLFAKEIGVHKPEVYFLVNALTLVISRPYAGKILDKKGPVRIMYFGFFTLLVNFVCLVFADGYLFFAISAILLGVGFGIVHSTALTSAINKVDAARRGVANGTLLTAFDLGLGFGSMVLGVLASHVGLKYMYLGSGFFVLVPLGIFWRTQVIAGKKEADHRLTEQGSECGWKENYHH